VASFDQYPFCLPAVRTLQQIDLHPKVTYFVGENGSGKSTLLEAIAVSLGFNAEGGSKNFRFDTRRSHSVLNEYLRIVKGVKRPRTGFFLRAESFFNVASEIERLDEGPGGPPVINSYGGRSLHEQSHGESFLALMLERFSRQGLYVLDEPEAAHAIERALPCRETRKTDGQSHSPGREAPYRSPTQGTLSGRAEGVAVQSST
jgi:predicted ATPase